MPNLVTLVEIQFEDFPIDAMTVEIDKVDLISRLKIIPFSFQKFENEILGCMLV